MTTSVNTDPSRYSKAEEKNRKPLVHKKQKSNSNEALYRSAYIII